MYFLLANSSESIFVLKTSNSLSFKRFNISGFFFFIKVLSLVFERNFCIRHIRVRVLNTEQNQIHITLTWMVRAINKMYGDRIYIKGYSQHYEIYTCTLLKMKPQREIKLPNRNEYLCFRWDSFTFSHGFSCCRTTKPKMANAICMK